MSAESHGLAATAKKTIKKALGRGLYREAVRAKHLVKHARQVRAAGSPAKGMHVIGVTGTNGKTTTSIYLFEILKAAGYKVALFSSTHYQIMDTRLKNETEVLATGENIKHFLSFYQKCKAAGITHVVQETTSQALHQFRVLGVPFEAAIFTNLTYEHMDYHGSMKHYAKAKGMLFRKKGIKYSVINRDDEWFDYFNQFSPTKRKLSYGTHDDSAARVSDIAMTLKGTTFSLTIDHEVIPIKIGQVGEYNIHNAAAAAAMAHCYGVKPATISKALARDIFLDGRLQPVNAGQPFAVFVDYAHTPDGITQIGKAMKAVTPGKTLLVQSVYDGRDQNKWPLLGEAAAGVFDHCYVCDEEAFTLPLDLMRGAIIKGYKNAKYTHYTEIPDRQTAIDTAIASMGPEDSIVIIPFGNNVTRTFYDVTEPWDDRDAARRALAKLGYTKKG